jgi:hypothetical protein
LATQSNSVTVTVTRPPAVYYIHADQIDTPRVVTDQANRVVGIGMAPIRSVPTCPMGIWMAMA